MRKLYIVFVAVLLGCTSQKRSNDSALSEATISLSYAEGFRVTNYEGAKLVEVLTPYQGATEELKYLLVKRGQEIPHHNNDVTVIQIPIRSIVCTSTTHIPLLDYLEESDKLVGFPTTDYISSKKVRERINNGLVTELGVDDAINIEKLTELKPDMLMGYTVTGNYGQYNKIEEMGIPVVMNGEYLEKHPLGRAEWIKFMALFFEKEAEANTVFSMIENNYIATKSLVASEVNKKTALSGVMYSDAWFLPGGQNYAAKILRDAGYNYLWSSDSSSGFLKLSFEAVLKKAQAADYWIGVASFQTLDEMKTTDHRYTLFKSFKEGNVYTYNARKGEKGGSEFLELGYLRPDIILKDLVKIYRPDLLEDHQLYFYKKLE